jgi:hypothetical protein
MIEQSEVVKFFNDEGTPRLEIYQRIQKQYGQSGIPAMKCTTPKQRGWEEHLNLSLFSGIPPLDFSTVSQSERFGTIRHCGSRSSHSTILKIQVDRCETFSEGIQSTDRPLIATIMFPGRTGGKSRNF